MQVTSETRYAEFYPFEDCMTPDGRKALIAGAQQAFGAYSSMTIDEFWALAEGDHSRLGDMKNPSVLQVYWLYGFEEWCKGLLDALEQLVIPSNPMENDKFGMGCVKMSATEQMLIFTKEYFNLHSFFEAGKRTMGEYFTARKDSFNKAMQQHNFNEWQKAKYKKK